MDNELAPPIRRPLGSATTERMQLRPFTDTDLDGLAAVFAKPQVWQFPYGRGFTRDETRAFLASQLQHWDRFGFGCWGAELIENHQIIGYVGLSVPQFLPESFQRWRSAGASTRSTGAVDSRPKLPGQLSTGASPPLGLDEICSLPQSLNPRSYKVCERIGMRFDRSVVCPATDRRDAVDARMYVLNEADWAGATDG